MLRTTYNAASRTWSGPPTLPVFSNRASLGLIAFHTLGINPDKVIQVSAEDGTRITGSEMKRDIIRVALNLMEKFKITKGDVIGIVGKNTKYLAAVAFAAFTIGASINPMDPSLSSSEISDLFNLSGPKLVFCDETAMDRVSDALSSLDRSDVPVIILSDNDVVHDGSAGKHNVTDLLQRHEEENNFLPPDVGDTDYLIGAILSSSGSTGPPKAVALTQTILKYYSMYSDFNVPSDHVRCCFSTLHWYSGVITLLASIVKASTRIITTRPFSPEYAVELIKDFAIHYFVFPARQLTLLSEYLKDQPTQLESIRHIDIGGSLANIKHIQKLKEYVPNGTIGNFYGMTEFFGLLTKRLDVTEKYCAGQLLTMGEVKIVNEAGQQVEINGKGEVLIKPWFPVLGYYNQGSLKPDCLTPDGFIRSGDIGFFDEEGDLLIVDRLKETFKYNNFHVSPSEIETFLTTLDGVFMAQVVGIPAECGVNFVATAFIVREKDSQITAETIERAVQSQFSEPKWLHGGVHFMDEFPTTVSGKVSKRLLKEWLLKRQ